ncbi:mitochondrial resolvase Ydc2 [Xylaria sp. FL0064]|nr:mitochondrial resolvase Ydc2 [Xylaria sp. FL0064]
MPAGSPALAATIIPRSLRAKQLKRLSFLCGLPVGGRKEELITRLTAAASNPSPSPSPARSRVAGPVVLSIDLGIRNLAYSLMTPVSTSASSRKKTKASSFSSTSPPAIKLHAWQRLSLLDSAAALSNSSDEDGADASSTAAFTPAVLAKTANAFLQETVMRLQPLPTHILIERQRWRSGGAPAIQEWTVRVNTLEAMLHASLRTLRDVGVWKGEVASIRPERVGQLFLSAEETDTAAPRKAVEEDVEDESGRKPGRKWAGGRKTSAETKKLKIELLGRWLGQGDAVIAPGNNSAGLMVDAYRGALNGTKRGRSKRAAKEEETGENIITLDSKLDDLTDSLMQGMAWLRWRENMALLRLKNGVEKLLE